jgi:hypothetical protein
VSTWGPQQQPAGPAGDMATTCNNQHPPWIYQQISIMDMIYHKWGFDIATITNKSHSINIWRREELQKK